MILVSRKVVAVVATAAAVAVVGVGLLNANFRTAEPTTAEPIVVVPAVGTPGTPKLLDCRPDDSVVSMAIDRLIGGESGDKDPRSPERIVQDIIAFEAKAYPRIFAARGSSRVIFDSARRKDITLSEGTKVVALYTFTPNGTGSLSLESVTHCNF